MSNTFDAVVVGGGPGGYVAAIRCAQLGMKTALVERDKIGGRCLNYACIPAKAVLRCTEVFDQVKDSERFGIKSGPAEIDFAAIGKYRDRVIKTLTSGVAGLLKKNQVSVLIGEAKLVEGGVEVSGEENTTLLSKRVILATGSAANSILGLQFGDRILDTTAAWRIEELPQSLTVVGAGASGVEIASAYARLGSKVTLVEGVDRVLPVEDPDTSTLVASELSKQGIDVVTSAKVNSITATSEAADVELADSTVQAQYVCIAAGRSADTAAIGLSELGVSCADSGLVEVDEKMSTSAAGIYAIGDLVAGPALAHKAMEEGVVAAEAAAGRETEAIDYSAIPAATFCKPPVASFGLTEPEAKQQYGEITVGKVPLGSAGAATVYGDRLGFIKIIGEPKLKEVVGAHIVGAKAPELIAEIVATKALEGGYAEIARTVHAHPTLSEAVQEAARHADGWLIHG